MTHAISGRYAIEVQQFDPATHKFHWVILAPSGLTNRPTRYNSREKAQRVVDVCYPVDYAIRARVVVLEPEVQS